jgi:hypothetical protein
MNERTIEKKEKRKREEERVSEWKRKKGVKARGRGGR